MKRFLILILLLPLMGSTQVVSPKSNLITVKGIGFNKVCEKILDAGYDIEKKDSELKTVRTERKEMPKFTAFYTINVRVKDSIAYISGKVTAPENGLVYKDATVFCVQTKEGKIKERDIMGYAFLKMSELAESLGGEVEYLKN